MTAAEETTETLRKEVSELKLRIKELGDENRDLRQVCNENGIDYEERLAARRCKRHFVHLCAEHPIETPATASDLLGAAPIVRGIAGCAGSVLRIGLIARCFFAAFTQLTAQHPWRFGGRLISKLKAHVNRVTCLSALEGGQLASGHMGNACPQGINDYDGLLAESYFKLIHNDGDRTGELKIWDSALLDVRL